MKKIDNAYYNTVKCKINPYEYCCDANCPKCNYGQDIKLPEWFEPLEFEQMSLFTAPVNG